jgi:hypothetical protein
MRPLTDEQTTQIMHYFPPRLGKFSIPSAGILDAPYYCLIINVEWIGHLIGVLDALDQLDAWQGTTEEIDNARQEVRKLISAINPCEDSNLVFRQDPSDPCKLEQSIDGGVNWTLAFDYSLCLEKQDTQQTIINYQEAIDYGDTYNTIYDGSAGSISDLAGDDNLDNLMCYVTSVLINSALDDAVDQLERERTITAGFSIISGIVAGLLFVPTGGASWLFMSAVLASVGAGIATGLTSLDIDTLNNQDARDLVICCMSEALAGSVPTELAFSQALDGCAFNAGSDEEQIRAIMRDYLQETDVYIAWLRLAEESKGIAGIGQLPCPCGQDDCQYFDEQPPTGEYEIIHGSWSPIGRDENSILNAQNVNSGVFPLEQSGLTSGIATSVRVNFASPRGVKKLSYSYWMQHNAGDQKIALYSRAYNSSDTLLSVHGYISDTGADGEWHTYNREYPIGLENVAYVIVYIFRTSDPTPTGTAYIDRVCVEA